MSESPATTALGRAASILWPKLSLQVSGEDRTLTIDTRVSLLDLKAAVRLRRSSRRPHPPAD